MRRAVLSAVVVLALAGCSFGGTRDADAAGPGVPPSGSGNARSYPVTDFDSIDLRGPDDVDVRVGSGFSVRAEGAADVLDRLRIVREGSTLRIGRREGNGFHWGDGDGIKVMVTMPRIVRAGVAGSGDVAIDRVEGARFDGSVAGSGKLVIASMQIDEAGMSVAGSGAMRAAGSARRLVASIAGSGGVDARDLKIDTAKISVAGSGSIRANVTGQADVDVAGSGSADLGAARCTIRTSGSGTVRCGGG